VSSRPSEPLRLAINKLFASVGTRFGRLDAQLEQWMDPWEPDDDVPEIIVRGAGTYDKAARIRATATSIQDLLEKEWEIENGEKRPVESGDVVVLCRSNNDVNAYARELSQHGLDARPDNGQSLYRSPEVVSVYRMLRLILNEGDASTLAAALPTPYLRDVDLRDREREAVQYGITSDNFLIDKFARAHSNLLAPSDDREGSKGTIDRLRKGVRKRTASQMLDQVYDEFDILSYYRDQGNTAAIQNLQRLREIARTLADDDQALTLRAFTDYLRGAIEVDQNEARVEADDHAGDGRPSYIRVMTIHRAKGLEFPFVVIPEMQKDLVRDWAPPQEMIFTVDHGLDTSIYGENDNVPDTRSPSFRAILHSEQARDVEEEMRVFYVGVTRAQHTVVLVGDGNDQPNRVEDDAFEGLNLNVDEYSWQDEVLRARGALEALANSRENPMTINVQFDD
jgi:ATP-dependent exoDNAse (exonuclease V) beta subunit